MERRGGEREMVIFFKSFFLSLIANKKYKKKTPKNNNNKKQTNIENGCVQNSTLPILPAPLPLLHQPKQFKNIKK